MEDSKNSRQGRQEGRSDFRAAQVPSNQDEDARLARPECGNLKRPVPQALILGQDDPATSPRDREPDSIFFVALEVVIVNLDR